MFNKKLLILLGLITVTANANAVTEEKKLPTPPVQAMPTQVNKTPLPGEQHTPHTSHHSINTKANNKSVVAETQKVIDEYKSFASNVPPVIRDEIIAYRKEIAQINKQKRILYLKLTQEAQNYLKKEQEFRRRLPIKERKNINLNQQ